MSPKFKTDTCRFAQLVTRNLVANNEKLVETHRHDFTFPFCTFKVHIFWEGYKILQNLHQLFVLCTACQMNGGDFTKFCGLLRIYELY